MRLRFVTADVFTTHVFGGNSLAVFPDARGLSDSQMQAIAREFNLSETAFVLPPDDLAHTRRLRIFTPGMELPFAGHPTVGAALVLVATGMVVLRDEPTQLILEENVGPVTVLVRHGPPPFAQVELRTPAQFAVAPPADLLARLLGLDTADIDETAGGPESVSAGVPFVMVPLASRDALKRARLRRDVWEVEMKDAWAPHVFLYHHDPQDTWPPVRARMFAPAMGIEEDPATGAAALCLAHLLARRDPRADGRLSWNVAQGVEMGRASLMEVQAHKVAGEVQSAAVGGNAVLVSEGTLDLGPA